MCSSRMFSFCVSELEFKESFPVCEEAVHQKTVFVVCTYVPAASVILKKMEQPSRCRITLYIAEI